ncbi:MAG: anti-sigma factor family protein [Actinomycetota bacterium]
MRCAEVKEMIPALARESQPSLAVRRHLGKCQGCRQELETYRNLVASLQTLEARTAEPPAGLAAQLIAIPAGVSTVDHLRSHVTRNRAAYAGGTAAAVAVAGAAAALLWRSRDRSPQQQRRTGKGRLATA